MKTLILGGGVVGVTTAYFLAKAGHEVTIVEEKDGLGLEATAGNAGIIAPGHSFAWASPRAPAHAVAVAARRGDGDPRAALNADPQLYAWGLRFLRECTAARARAQHADQAPALPVQPGRPERRWCGPRASSTTRSRRGALYLHRDPEELEAGVKKMALLAEHGQKQEILDANAVARLDPVFEPVQGRRSPARSATSATPAATRACSSRSWRASAATSTARW